MLIMSLIRKCVPGRLFELDSYGNLMIQLMVLYTVVTDAKQLVKCSLLGSVWINAVSVRRRIIEQLHRCALEEPLCLNLNRRGHGRRGP